MTQLDHHPLRRPGILATGILATGTLATGILAISLALAVPGTDAAWARQDGSTPATAASPALTPDESVTVLGRRHRFEAAPVPGAPLGPPPDKPGPHLGRYKISGDQTPKDGFDAQTGAYIAPFGTAYTGASPTADGLASRLGH